MPWKATVEYQNEIATAFANTQRPFKSLAMTTIRKKNFKNSLPKQRTKQQFLYIGIYTILYAF